MDSSLLSMLKSPMTTDEIVLSANWMVETDYLCDKCKKPAVKEAAGRKRWGCRSEGCKFLTCYPSTFFSNKTAAIA